MAASQRTVLKKWKFDHEIQLIEHVKSNPHLWNVKHSLYLNRNLKRATYCEIAESLATQFPEDAELFNVDEVMNKFGNLRTVFRRVCNEHKSKPSGSGSLGFTPRYKHYFALQFLNDTFEATESTSNILIEASSSNVDDTDVAQDESFNEDENSVIQESVSEVPILNTNQAKEQKRKRKKNDDDVRTLAVKTLQDLTNQPDDEDDAYGQYLAKVMKTLDPVQKDYLKMEIQNLIFKIRHQTSDE